MKLKVALLSIAAGVALPVWATDGYFASGYGITAKGMGGAATAMSKDTFGGANNPASMVWVGNRVDVGVEWFSPQRKASRSGSLAGLDGEAKSDSTNFYIPEFGYNHMLNDYISLGVTVYGNGGMNTNYPGGQVAAGNPVCGGFAHPSPGPYNLLCGSGRLNMDLAQVIIAPTLAYKLNERHSIGISPLLAYQRFKIDGLDSFQFFTPSMTPGKLSNAGYDSSRGFGVRVGWMGKINEALTLGAAYSTKLKMSNFDKYKELYAEQGGFDIPENFSLGRGGQGQLCAYAGRWIISASIMAASKPLTTRARMPARFLAAAACHRALWVPWVAIIAVALAGVASMCISSALNMPIVRY